MLLPEVARYLHDNSIGTIGTNIFKAFVPDSPHTCITVYSYPGSAPSNVFGSSNAAWEQPRFQIVCRSSEYSTADKKARDVWNLLNNVTNITLKPSTAATGCLYLRIEPLQSPFDLGDDDNGRSRIVCNYEAMKGVST